MMWAPVVLAALILCGTAGAAPVTVDLRVEGTNATLFEDAVTTDAKTIDMGDGPHPCDGTNLGANPVPGPTMTSALDDARAAGGLSWAGSWNPGFEDFSVDTISSPIGSHTNDTVSFRFWGYALNYGFPSVGGCQQPVQTGDQVLFVYDAFGKPMLELTGPEDPIVRVGDVVALTVTDGVTGDPVAGASIDGVTGVTGADGRLDATFSAIGATPLIKARLDGTVRSNAIQLCVEAANECSGFTAPGVAGVQSLSGVRDSAAPIARISGPRNGRKYRRGPRLLRGTASDEGSGVREVKLSIRRHVRGKGCQWWSGRRDRFVGRNCRKTFFFAIGDDASWSYLLPRPLGPGRYVVDVKVFDARRNRNDRFIPGENRAVFEVLRSKSRRTGRSAAGSARVKTMIVGKNDVLVDPITVRAGKTVVRASGRRCAVAASTPLGALQAALRRKRIGYAVRDYGSCARRNTRSSGQLFVTRIAGEHNSGSDGWVFKIDDRTPGIGAADARLRAGDRLLWLYCTQDQASGGCQRSLRVVPANKSGPAGGPLPVRVFGYDDKRTRRPVPGARIAITNGDEEVVSAVSSPDGTAVLTLPPAGRYQLVASADGLAPSFPVTVRTR
jgi:hypothetical protein